MKHSPQTLLAICLFYGLLSSVYAYQKPLADFDWKTDARFADKRGRELKNLEDLLFNQTVTDAVVIVKSDRIIYEKYANGYSQDKLHFTWSVSKSFVNALYGIAVREGKLKLADSVCDHYKFPTENHCKIKIDDLLRWSSGMLWKEEYEDSQSPKTSSVLAMLYGAGHKDKSGFAASHIAIYEPGSVWRYSSGESNLLAGILKSIYASQYDEFPWRELFNKIGMKKVVWERDLKGVFVGASYLYASARDFARFGRLYLKNGNWQGQQILAKGWVDYTREIAPAFSKRLADRNDPNDIGGAHFWLNRAVKRTNIEKPWPAAPEDTFAARGHWGQFIFIVPSLDLLIVRLGNDRERQMDLNHFLKLALDYAK